MALEQIIVQRLHDFEARRVAIRFKLQLERYGMQNLVGRYAGMGEIDGFDVCRQACLQHVAQHGLAAADFARYLDYALAIADGIDHRFEDRPAVAAAEKEFGVRRDLERRLGEPEVAVVHGRMAIWQPDAACRPGSRRSAFCGRAWW